MGLERRELTCKTLSVKAGWRRGQAGKEKEKDKERNLEHIEFDVTTGYPNKYSNRRLVK
jgi:hypothetical protein